jgi:hypothetical protein
MCMHYHCCGCITQAMASTVSCDFFSVMLGNSCNVSCIVLVSTVVIQLLGLRVVSDVPNSLGSFIKLIWHINKFLQKHLIILPLLFTSMFLYLLLSRWAVFYLWFYVLTYLWISD